MERGQESGEGDLDKETHTGSEWSHVVATAATLPKIEHDNIKDEISSLVAEYGSTKRAAKERGAIESSPSAQNSTAATLPIIKCDIKDEISSVIVEVGASKGTATKKLFEKPTQFKRKSAPEPRLNIKSEENSGVRVEAQSLRMATKERVVTKPSPSEQNSAAVTLPKVESDGKDEISSLVVEVGALKGSSRKKVVGEPVQFKRESAVVLHSENTSEVDEDSIEQEDAGSSGRAKTTEIGNLSIKPKLKRDEDDVASLLVEVGCNRRTATKNLDRERFTRSKSSVEEPELQLQNEGVTDDQPSSGSMQKVTAPTPPHDRE